MAVDVAAALAWASETCYTAVKKNGRGRFLTEANAEYAEELEQFKDEVLRCDDGSADQFAGCNGPAE